MRPLKIILTACGCPGASTLIRKLYQVEEREIEIIGVDMDDEAVGRFLCDDFHQVPPGRSGEYIPAIKELISEVEPDVLFPESSYEVPVLARHRRELEALGTTVLVSDPQPLEVASNKYKMYEALKDVEGVPLPAYHSVDSLESFVDAARKLGYPDRPVCFKPHVGKGSRGVRIMDPDVDRRRQLMEQKPNSLYISMEEVRNIFQDEPSFPDLLVMEYLDGQEVTADSICLQGEELMTSVKSVEQARWGVIVKGELLDRPDIVRQAKIILEEIPLSYCVNIQFLGDQLIEINPRVSTFIYQDDLIQPYLAIKFALGEMTEADVRRKQEDVDVGRRMVRYMDQVFWTP